MTMASDMLYHRCEELREIVRRLAKVLPGQEQEEGPSNLEAAPGWSWQRTVIEAKPIMLAPLILAFRGWKFDKQMPPLYQDMQSRRRFVREQTRLVTTTACTTASSSAKTVALPEGSSLWHATDEARGLLLLAKQDARLLFDTVVMRSLHGVVPMTSNKEFVTLFDNNHGEDPVDMCFRDSVKILRKFAPYVARLAEEYGKSLTWMYGIGAREFEEGCRLRLQWVKPGCGTPVELLPVSPCRYENGPVVFAALGPSVAFHDLVPSLADPSTSDDGPIRLSVPEGVMLAMDGASRVRYAVGTPSGTNDSRFNLIFLLDCSARSFPVSYERETRAIAMQTPVVHDHVVSTLIDLPTTRNPPVQMRDCYSVTMGILRRKLRASESHVITEKCLQVLHAPIIA